MRHRMIGLTLLTLCLAGCGTAVKKPDPAVSVEARQKKMTAYSDTVRKAFDLGFSQSLTDSAYVEDQGRALMAYTLYEFYAPYAGARRLLDMQEKSPASPLPALLIGPAPGGKAFPFQDSAEFMAGNFPNAFESTLFDPFYRVALREYVVSRPEDIGFERLSLALKEAVRLTPRYADYFPLDLSPETKKAFEDYLKAYPEGPLSDRFRFYLALPGKLTGWGKKPEAADARLNEIMKGTKDELLSQEIQETLNTGFFSPGRSFFWSLAIPGAGQIVNGDVQGGLLMAGLSGAAWWWAASRLAVAQNSSDDATRKAALGDAAWGLPLVAFAHGFAATTASSQARFVNLTIEWDILSRQRLAQ